MGTYQAPQVPQPGVTFGDERFVDPWAATMLQNTCRNLQVQNMALQQENAALKTKANLCSSSGRIRFVKQLIALICENSLHIKQRISQNSPMESITSLRKTILENSTRLSSPCQTVQNSLLDMRSIHGTALRVLKSGTDFLTELFQASVLPMTNFSRTL